jgi:hypothetical protein
MKTQEELIAIAKTILDENKHAALSGSLGLAIQGINIRRKPQDIDINVPSGVRFMMLPNMKIREASSDQYESDGYTLEAYTLEGVNIDVLISDYEDTDIGEIIFNAKNKIRLVESVKILSFKMQHSLDDNVSTRHKHKYDLIHILVNN